MSTTQPGATTVARTSARLTDRTTLILFFTLAYGLSWAVWGSTLARDAGLIAWSIPPEPFGFLAVSVAAVVATVTFGGRAALRSLGSRLAAQSRECCAPHRLRGGHRVRPGREGREV